MPPGAAGGAAASTSLADAGAAADGANGEDQVCLGEHNGRLCPQGPREGGEAPPAQGGTSWTMTAPQSINYSGPDVWSVNVSYHLFYHIFLY